MASIAFDASSVFNFGTPAPWFHTCGLDASILAVHIRDDANGVTGLAYAGIAATLGGSVNDGLGHLYRLFYLIHPPAGTHQIVITNGGGSVSANAASWTGARLTSVPDVTVTTATSSASTIAIATTTRSDNCWVMFAVSDRSGSTPTANANCTLRAAAGSGASTALFDSNGVVHPAGTLTQTANVASSAHATAIALAFAPAVDGKLYLALNYVDVSSRTRNSSAQTLQVQDILNDSPDSATFRLQGTAPQVGQDVQIVVGAKTLFGGTVQSFSQVYEGRKTQLAWDVVCTDYIALLNRRLPFGTFSGSATTVAQSVISSFASGFTSTFVQSSLPTVTVTFDGSQQFSDCMSQLATLIGGYWYVDASKNVHLFTSEAFNAPDAITDGSLTLLDDDTVIAAATDTSQLRTRVYVKGGGSTATAAVGTIANSTTVIGRPGPVNSPTITEGAAASISGGNYQVKVTFEYSDGIESLPSPASNTLAASGTKKIHSTLELGDGRVTGRREYYQFNSGGFVSGNNFTDIADNSTTAADLTLQNLGRLIPSAASGYSSGTTFLYVADTAQFNTGGGTAFSGALTFTYTGKSTSSGPGALTGIPSSGAGSIGSSISIGDSVGAVSINVADITPFDSGGGTVITGTQIITYGGISSGCHIVARPAPIGLTLSEGASTGSFTPGSYQVEYAFIYSDGVESLPSAPCAPVVMSGSKFFHLVVSVGDANVVGRREYYAYAGTGFLFLSGNNLTDIADNTTTAIDLALQNYARAPQSVSAGFAVGATYLYVGDCSQFSSGGGTARTGGQTFTYTGRTASSGVGALTGIPSSGTGSLVAPVSVGDVIFPSVGGSGALTGIPLTGAGSIVNPISSGDAVNIWVQRDNASAQSSLAALEGGDGIHEFLISDDSQMSISACNALGDSELALFAYPIVTVTYSTRDLKTASGKDVSINLTNPPIVGTLKIQQVVIDQFEAGGGKNPRFTVTASSVRFSLDNILSRLLAAA